MGIRRGQFIAVLQGIGAGGPGAMPTVPPAVKRGARIHGQQLQCGGCV